MKKNKHEQGQALVLVTLAIIGLLGITGLVVDVGMTYTDRRDAQGAADTAAMAAALARVRGQNITNAAQSRSAANGYDNSATPGMVVVNNPPLAGCDGTNSPYAGNNQYIQVLIYSDVDTYFAPLVGVNQTHNCVEAIARATTAQQSGLMGGNAIVALKPTGNSTLDLNGNIHLTTIGGGTFANSSGSQAFSANGNLTFDSDVGIFSVGGARFVGNVTVNTDIFAGGTVSTAGNIHLNGAVNQHASVPPYPDPPEVPAPQVSAPAITCDRTGTYSIVGSTVRLTPGNHPARSISGNYTVEMEPGNYCFTGNYSISGNIAAVNANNVAINMGSKDLSVNGNFTFNTDNSQFYFSSGDLSLNGNLVFSASNSTIYIDSGSFTIDGNSTPALSNCLVYLESGDFKINGNMNPTINSAAPSVFYLDSGDLRFNGNSRFTSTNTLFYLNSGSMRWNGNTEINMSAPTSGPYQGLLFYMPVGNTSSITINGNSSSRTIGSIIAPRAAITINGNSQSSAFNSQIIGYTIKISGNAGTTVQYDASQNYTEASPASISLVK